MPALQPFLDQHLIEDWRFKLTRLWTLRVALFWAALSAFAAVYPFFGGLVPQAFWPMFLFALSNVFLCVVIMIARMAKQKGVDE